MFAQRMARFTQVCDDCFIKLLSYSQKRRNEAQRGPSDVCLILRAFGVDFELKEKVHLYRVMPKTAGCNFT